MLPTMRLQKSMSFVPPPSRESEGVAGGGIRVWLMDESYKAMHVDVDRTSVEDLWNLLCDKIGLSPEASECFYLYGCGKELELLLIGEDSISTVMKTWIDVEHKYFPWVTFEGFEGGQAVSSANDKEAIADKAAADSREKDARAKLSRSSKLGESISRGLSSTIRSDKSDGALSKSQSSGGAAAQTVRVVERPSPVRFFFKTTEISPLPLRRKAMGDKIALRLLYIEAVYYVLKGWYPVTQQQAVKLGGLQLQAYVGDSNAAHAPGFLTTDQNWKNYVPKHLRHAIQPQDWEVALLGEHVKHRGKVHETCMVEYLNVVMEVPLYGSSFYNVKMQKEQTAFFSHEFDSNVLLAVNDIGIHVIDAFSMKFETHAHGTIKDWKASDKIITVVLSSGHPKKLKFKTKQTDLINELLGAWQAEWRGSHRSVRMSQRRGSPSNDSPV